LRLAIIAALGLGLSATAAGATERREHGAHEHGHGTMHVVLEGEALAIEIAAPGMDVVGFEHAPGDDADKARIARALERLEDAAAMFALPAAAACVSVEAHAEHGALEAEGHDDHADHEKHEKHADHGHKHGAAAKDDHDHDHDQEGHSAFHAHYEWRCAQPDALQRIVVRYFEHFPGTEEIEALILGPDGQTARELTADAPEIGF